MLTIGKPFGVWCPTRATLAGPTRIDRQEPSSGAFGLVRKFVKECRPSCTVYRFRKQPTGRRFSGDHRIFAASCGGCSHQHGAHPAAENPALTLKEVRGALYPRPEGRGFTAPPIILGSGRRRLLRLGVMGAVISADYDSEVTGDARRLSRTHPL